MIQEYIFVVKEKGKNETWEEKASISENETPEQHFEKILKDWNKDFPDSQRELVKVIGKSGIIFCDFGNGKVNQLTILRNNLTYDILICKNCKIFKRRFGLGENFPYESTKCYPDLSCNECNKVFKTEKGIKNHKMKDKHKIPDWLPDGV